MDKDAERISDALRKTLDRHGYGFHYSLLKVIGEFIPVRWHIEATEFPVRSPAGTTHIDFVLAQAGPDVGVPTRIVGECKRADPALVDWCFVKLPYVRRPSDVALERIRIDLETKSVFAGPSFQSSWAAERVYHQCFPVKGDTKGEGQGHGRTALDDAVAQVLRGTNGLINYLAGEPSLLRQYGSHAHGRVVPAIFTTANLWGSETDVSLADLRSGKLAANSDLRPLPWLWLKQNVSPDLKHAFPPFEPSPEILLDDLSAHAQRRFSRCIAIVNAFGVAEFLSDLMRRVSS